MINIINSGKELGFFKLGFGAPLLPLPDALVVCSLAAFAIVSLGGNNNNNNNSLVVLWQKWQPLSTICL